MIKKTSILAINNFESFFQQKKLLWADINKISHLKHLGLKQFQWPDEVHIPIDQWTKLFESNLESQLKTNINLDISNILQRTAFLSLSMTLAAWRVSMNCYLLHDDLKPHLINSNGGFISNSTYKSITDWTVCIDTKGINFGDSALNCFYAHKNIINIDGVSTPVIIFILNNLTIDSKTPQLMPYFVLKYTDDLSTIEKNIVSFGGFSATSTNDFVSKITPIVAMLNSIFNPITIIESDYVGIRKPSYKDVKFNVNFDEFNFPSFKYLSPSNPKIWHAGINLIADLNSLERNHPDEAHVLEWDLSDGVPTIKIK